MVNASQKDKIAWKSIIYSSFLPIIISFLIVLFVSRYDICFESAKDSALWLPNKINGIYVISSNYSDFQKCAYFVETSGISLAWMIWLISVSIFSIYSKIAFSIDGLWIVSIIMMALALLNSLSQVDGPAGFWSASINNGFIKFTFYNIIYIIILYFFSAILFVTMVSKIFKIRNGDTPEGHHE